MSKELRKKQVLLNLEDGREVVADYVEVYSYVWAWSEDTHDKRTNDFLSHVCFLSVGHEPPCTALFKRIAPCRKKPDENLIKNRRMAFVINEAKTLKRRIAQIRDSLNKCKDSEQIEKCAEILKA